MATTTLAPVAPPSTQEESALQLDQIVANTRRCLLRPFSFFVSWQGVVTLAFRGFPPALTGLKAQLGEHYTALPPENPGSRWPKSSLGAVKEGKRLSPEQLDKLNTICREASAAFVQALDEQAVLVDRLASVVYQCRCLERQVSKQEVALAEPLDPSDPEASELTRVQGIVAEADDPNYWYHASRDGSRENHYRGNAMGVTLVHELSCFQPTRGPANGSGAFSTALPGLIRSFRDRVDEALPGMYSWFNDTSLHITVRAIIS